ncbi:MAG: Nif3-like dinuclear metal center hexameric protein [Dethiobacter sp.]|jgi:uncharacterized protein YbjQ (UPF0145 family)|nr:Nif3-like dinuclear metal center hexameric protein [Dethiobacter sp.]
MPQTVVADVVAALDRITGGRVITDVSDLTSGKNPYVVIKSSNIPGKAIAELPGLVFGDLNKSVKRLAVAMTLTEQSIELAGATGVDAIVAHHPVADAASSGGVPLKFYLSLYGLAVLELHEAFHGLHPGIPFIHGHRTFRVDVAYGGIPGNVIFFGKALENVKTVGDILRRLETFSGRAQESKLLNSEMEIRGCPDIQETVIANGPLLFNGEESSAVSTIIHITPHGGLTPQHLEQAVREHPDADTVICSISRVKADSPLVQKARELGLNFIVGNTHALEILENGMPLAYAIRSLLPEVEVVLFRERVTSVPLDSAGSEAIRDYARDIAGKYLTVKKD